MILADTSVWIDFLRGKDSARELGSLLEMGNVVGVSVVFGELLQGAKTDLELKIIETYFKHVPKINESDLMAQAGKYSYQHNLFSKGVGLLDCALIVAAQENHLKLWTLDKKLAKVIPPKMIFSAHH